jgi:hypothetical protein
MASLEVRMSRSLVRGQDRFGFSAFGVNVLRMGEAADEIVAKRHRCNPWMSTGG